MVMTEAVPQEFRRRCAEVRERELQELRTFLLRLKRPELTDFTQRRAAVKLRFLIASRRAAGQWPPTGDEVDSDPELLPLLQELCQEEINSTISGPDFRAAVKVGARRDRRDVNDVLRPLVVQRNRDLMVKRIVFKQRALRVLTGQRK